MSWDQMGDPNGRELGPMMRCCGEVATVAAYRSDKPGWQVRLRYDLGGGRPIEERALLMEGRNNMEVDEINWLDESSSVRT